MSKGKQFKDYADRDRVLMIEQLNEFFIWFEKIFGLKLYLIYGTLLGSIREQNLILNDNDIDIAYLSQYNKFEDVFKEMIMINIIIKNLGYSFSFGQGGGLPEHSGHSHIYSPDKTYIFDVWTSWIDKNGKYNFYSMGKDLSPDILLPFSSSKLLHRTFTVPNKSQDLLKYLYSADWKVPLNRKSFHYIKDYWKPLINIYKEKYLNKGK
jgi:hypothetical protein